MLISCKRFRRVNENDLAEYVAAHEGKKVELPIGQIKEVQRLLLDWLAAEWIDNPRGVAELLRRHSA